jgi:pimeloyl-ACP methyl ester carboxylesterase
VFQQIRSLHISLTNTFHASELAPANPISSDNLHFVSRQAFLVAKDFGARPAYDFALRHPDRTCGVMCLGVPFVHGGTSFATLPEGFYILRWQVFT